jgi:hypothetical protein
MADNAASPLVIFSVLASMDLQNSFLTAISSATLSASRLSRWQMTHSRDGFFGKCRFHHCRKFIVWAPQKGMTQKRPPT